MKFVFTLAFRDYIIRILEALHQNEWQKKLLQAISNHQDFIGYNQEQDKLKNDMKDLHFLLKLYFNILNNNNNFIDFPKSQKITSE